MDIKNIAIGIKSQHSFGRNNYIKELMLKQNDITDTNEIKKIIISELSEVIKIIKANYVDMKRCMRSAIDESNGHRELLSYILCRWDNISTTEWWKQLMKINKYIPENIHVLNIAQIQLAVLTN